MAFLDRADAGRRLARELRALALDKPMIVALPRGGVPVAAEIARDLGVPIEPLIVRKIGLPRQPELAMGAIVDGDEPIVVRNAAVIASAGVSEAEFAAIRDQELTEIRRRRRLYRGDAPYPDLKHRTVIVVDDGIATGATMRAALQALKSRHAQRLVLAVPVAAPDALEKLRQDADDIVCLEAHDALGAVGFYYRDFSQVSDDEVVRALALSRSAWPQP